MTYFFDVPVNILVRIEAESKREAVYLVHGLIEGHDLHDHITGSGPFSPARSLEPKSSHGPRASEEASNE